MVTAYITAPESDADDIAAALVEERLAACVNTVPCSSLYRWDGDVHEDDEVILLAKTTSDAVETLFERVEESTPTMFHASRCSKNSPYSRRLPSGAQRM
jgi:periplasmic divalent cation tolerance protein